MYSIPFTLNVPLVGQSNLPISTRVLAQPAGCTSGTSSSAAFLDFWAVHKLALSLENLPDVRRQAIFSSFFKNVSQEETSRKGLTI